MGNKRVGLAVIGLLLLVLLAPASGHEQKKHSVILTEDGVSRQYHRPVLSPRQRRLVPNARRYQQHNDDRAP